MKRTLNTTINRSKNEKNDEHYTQLSDITNNAYTFDAIARPIAHATGITGTSPVDSTFAYDTIGNRLWSAANAVTNEYAANNLNHYTSMSGSVAPQTSFTHDADGNMTGDGVFAYAYDAENRLVSVTSAAETNGAIRVLNAYDHRNRRICKTVQRLHSTIAPPPSPPVGIHEWEPQETHNKILFENGQTLEIGKNFYSYSGVTNPIPNQLLFNCLITSTTNIPNRCIWSCK